MSADTHSRDGAGLETDTLDPATVELVEQINAMLYVELPLGSDPMVETRKLASHIFQTLAGPDAYPKLRLRDSFCPSPAGDIPLRTYFHSGTDHSPAPTIVFFHGGGWALGCLDDYDVLLKSLAVQSGANIVSVGYRLAPENPFPRGLEDAQLALDHIINHPEIYEADPVRLAVMGDSAGGNLAAVLAQSPVNQGKLVAQFLLYPMLDVFSPHETYPSRQIYGDGSYFLMRDAIDSSRADYAANTHSLDDWRISPLLGNIETTLPSTYILVGNCDPLRDEAIAYADRLGALGLEVDIDCIPGAIHAFLSFGTLPDTDNHRTGLAMEIRRRLA